MRPARVRALPAAVAVLLLAGCGGSGAGGAVDIPSLEHELATVIRLQTLSEGYDFDVSVTCRVSSGLLYSCRVVETTANGGIVVNQWAEGVDCTRSGLPIAQRCVTASGFALQ